jgi:hypothetical protein
MADKKDQKRKVYDFFDPASESESQAESDSGYESNDLFTKKASKTLTHWGKTAKKGAQSIFGPPISDKEDWKKNIKGVYDNINTAEAAISSGKSLIKKSETIKKLFKPTIEDSTKTEYERIMETPITDQNVFKPKKDFLNLKPGVVYAVEFPLNGETQKILITLIEIDSAEPYPDDPTTFVAAKDLRPCIILFRDGKPSIHSFGGNFFLLNKNNFTTFEEILYLFPKKNGNPYWDEEVANELLKEAVEVEIMNQFDLNNVDNVKIYAINPDPGAGVAIRSIIKTTDLGLDALNLVSQYAKSDNTSISKLSLPPSKEQLEAYKMAKRVGKSAMISSAAEDPFKEEGGSKTKKKRSKRHKKTKKHMNKKTNKRRKHRSNKSKKNR